jgi:hypothetical protein
MLRLQQHSSRSFPCGPRRRSPAGLACGAASPTRTASVRCGQGAAGAAQVQALAVKGALSDLRCLHGMNAHLAAPCPACRRVRAPAVGCSTAAPPPGSRLRRRLRLRQRWHTLPTAGGGATPRSARRAEAGPRLVQSPTDAPRLPPDPRRPARLARQPGAPQQGCLRRPAAARGGRRRGPRRRDGRHLPGQARLEGGGRGRRGHTSC